MTEHDENGAPTGGDDEPNREVLQQRVRELEAENRALRADIEQLRQSTEIDRQELEWYHSLGLPLTETEMLEQARTGPSISDVIADCEREFGK